MYNELTIMKQEWHNLLFLHWNIPASKLTSLIPKQLKLDTYNDKAWIGIIPFQMQKLRFILTPSVPVLSNFPEINLRTYVKDKYNRKGVWFFSLSTQNIIGNWIAKNFYHLNYNFAKTKFNKSDSEIITFRLELDNLQTKNQTFSFKHSRKTFKPCENPESLEYFLTERYRLFAHDIKSDKIFTGIIEHKPYELNRPKVLKYTTGLFSQNKIGVINAEPFSVLACERIKVNVKPLKIVT